MSKKICIAASSGGHLEEAQKLIKPLTERGYEVFLVTEKVELNTINTNVPTYYLKQVNRKEAALLPNTIINTFRSLKILLKERPDVMITTGVLAIIPMFYLCKLMRIKTIFIESICRVTDKTMTGKLLYKTADCFYVQWPTMLSLYPTAKYAGRLL